MGFKQELETHCRAGFGGIWIVTDEQREVLRSLAELINDGSWTSKKWTPASEESLDEFLDELILEPKDVREIVIIQNPEKYFEQFPEIAHRMLQKVDEAKQCLTNFVVISPRYEVPPMLSRSFCVLEHDLPDHEELLLILNRLNIPVSNPDEVATAASGLTRTEAEDAFALSYVRNEKKDVLPKDVWEIKAKELKKSGCLELYQGNANFDELCGLDAMKQFCSRCAGHPDAKGVLLLGVPGGGKSQFAKALGNEVGLPTISMDFGAMMGSLVGQTEERIRRALKTVDRLSPCVLFVDEIEKALSGAGGSNDSGVSQRMLGTLLTWLNDRESSVYFVGTCNDIQQLSQVSAGAFTRAERFDRIFYIGLPSEEQRDAMWDLYLDFYNIESRDIGDIDDQGWTGAEIKSCCRLASMMDIPVTESATMIVPVVDTAGPQIKSLNEWADGRALDANSGNKFKKSQATEKNSSRVLS